jgi:hypothetical protein
MPVVSRFYGIIVFFNYNDHNPPHFHARYQDQQVIIEFEGGVVTGTMARYNCCSSGTSSTRPS